MSYKVLFVLNALVAIVVGLALLFVPAIGLDQFGTEKYEATIFVARLFGLAAFTIGLLLWFAKNISDANIQKQMGVVMFVSAIIGLVVTVIGVSPASGVIRLNSWIPIVLFALSALGYGFMLFLKPRMKE
jgi:hypothetical protein